MTDRGFAWIVLFIMTVFFWTFVTKMVLTNSRQTCEQTTSAETCAWELR